MTTNLLFWRTVRITGSLLIALLAPYNLQAADSYGSSGTNVSIPDAGSWVRSTITISGAPSNATVTGIDVHFSAVHPYSADLDVDLNDAGVSRNHDIWRNEGGSADNPSRTLTGITTFNGLPVNGQWHLYAKDTVAGDAGYIDEWWIRIYYSSGTSTYAVYAKIDPLNYGLDADGDGYYETFNFNLCADGDAVPGPASVHAKLISNSTGQAWWSNTAWTVSGTAVDYKCFPFDETDFSGYLSGNTSLDFTVELWNSGKTTKLATDTSVDREPVKAERANTYALYGTIFDLLYGVDADRDGFYETYQFNLCVDADATPGPATVYARLVSVTTNQAWWSSASWSVSGSTTDYKCFAFSEADFASAVTGNTSLDFTVEIWNSGKSIKLATDTSVGNEPVKADRASLSDTAGPKTGTGLGVLGDTKNHIDTYYDDGVLGFFDKYLLEDQARRANQNPHAHNGQMTSSSQIETRIYDTDGLVNFDKMEDDDNIWNAAEQRSGVDAHVYAARVYDYLRAQWSLNGVANNGGSMLSVVEVTELSDGTPCSDNAFWNGERVLYCVPDGFRSTAAAMDVVAHEWGHALSQLLAGGLGHSGEAGALNEAFSDWMGASVEAYHGVGSPWLMGEALTPNGWRNLANPRALSYQSPRGTFPYPDTYDGEGWWPPSDCSWDDCGEHVNSTVAGRMFHLLAVGGTKNGISVTGLGIQTAMRIAIDANRYYWSAASDFADARLGMRLAAQALHSSYDAQVMNAWAAVGVGAPARSLTGLSINGPSSINESSSTSYTATASWSDGTTSTVTPSWSEGSPYASISSSGVLSASAVASNQTVTVTASYTYGSVTRTATRTVTILNTVSVLTGLTINGPASVNEGSTATYTATAIWSDGATSGVTPAWSDNSSIASISGTGVLAAVQVSSDHTLTVTATYSSGGITKVATRTVTIVNRLASADFFTVPACRVIDTRNPIGTHGGPALSSGSLRIFTLTGRCGIPADAQAVSVNVTVVGATGNGYLSLFPGNLGSPQTSTVNFNTGLLRSNNTVLLLATNGTGTLGALASVAGATGQVHLILDVSGYFR